MIPRIYFISGLGADHRLFSRQLEDKIPLTILPWKIPFPDETLASYVQRMAETIPPGEGPVILGGVSFGGMIALEMSKLIPAEKVILISSVKSHRELPLRIRFWKNLPLHRLMSGNLLKKAGYIARIIFGKMNKEESGIFLQMVSDANPQFIKWAMHQIVTWKNDLYPENIVHIHGTNDFVFPFEKLIPPVIPIQHGTHIMIVTEAGRINTLLKKECKVTG